MVAGLGHVSILPAGAAIPSGWKETNGELLSTDAYRSLFLVIGTTYGGNGVTTFALPTWSGTVIGAGARFIMRVR